MGNQGRKQGACHMGIWQRSGSRSMSRRSERLRGDQTARGRQGEERREGRYHRLTQGPGRVAIVFSYSQIQNKVPTEKKEMAE